MSLRKHTPGPWGPIGGDYSGRLTHVLCRGYTIASAVVSNQIEPTVAEANAELIAAAPDLLVALQRLLAVHHTGSKSAAAEAARAAVAKATGSKPSSA